MATSGVALADDGGKEPFCASCVAAAARVFCGGEHTLLRDPDTLAVFQLGACGLGFNHDDEEAAKDPQAYEAQVPLPGPAIGVCAGSYHNLLKIVGGRCVAYGCGRQSPNDGQLANGSLSEDTLPVPACLRFADAAAGGHHSVCRTASGELWACGAGWQGQMGDGGLTYKNPEPRRVQGIPRVQRVSGGYYHNAALTEDDELYVWGCNEQGQLGIVSSVDASGQDEGAPPQVSTPRPLREALPELNGCKARMFDGGYGHSLVLLEDGRLLTMGNHSEGQRAIDPDLEDPPPANEVTGLGGPVLSVAAGNHHTLAVVGGRVVAFGSDEYGQVGRAGG